MDAVFMRHLTNSLIVASCNAILVAILAVMATYALSRYKPGRKDNIFFWTITNRMRRRPLSYCPCSCSSPRCSRGDWSLYDTRIGYPALLPLQPALRHLADEGYHGRYTGELDEACFVDGATPSRCLPESLCH